MLAPDDYTLGKCLHTDPRYQLFSAVRDSDRRRVALKLYTSPKRSRARAEFEALTALAGPGIALALDLLDSPDGQVLVLDQIQDASLRSWVRAGPRTEAELLEVAIQLTQALMHVHAAHWLHRDLRPEHVWIASAPLRVQLTGFGRALPFGTASDPEDLRIQSNDAADLLPFIAPEQTGRMGRGIDARSDLYSLGATFYFALTGKPPFESDDALALVHAHMARLPISPLVHRPGLSPALARIVLKLLQKQPEDRYQTARALEHDLCTCRDQLGRAGRIQDDLPLGTSHTPVRPLFRKNLHGREAELAELQAAYERAARGGSELVWVRGVAGSGKSSLVQELRPLLPPSGGYLATGKFDDYRRDVPFAGVSAAFGALLDQLFTESDASLARWRRDLEVALGGLAGVLVDLIPDLELLLGGTARLPALGTSESAARLAIAVQRFVKGCASSDHPLVLFLDDVQWADPGTLELVEALVLHGGVRHLLVILSYREEEVRRDHAVAELAARLAERSAHVSCISLGPISLDATAELLAEAFGRGVEVARELAAAVLRKTGGIPLLIQQFTLHLHAIGLIRFEEPDGWAWDPVAVEQAEIPEGAVGLIVAKLERLGPEALEVLQFASAVSYEFDAAWLAELSGRTRDSLDSALRSIADEGLIVPSARGFRFVHDRVREAARTMMSAEECARVHFSVAEHLLGTLDAQAVQARIFELLEHLNRGASCVPEALRLRVVELNMEAGRLSLATGAAATALHYLQLARSSLEALDPSAHHRLRFDLLLLCAECAFRTGDTTAALEILSLLDQDSLTKLESARLIGLRVQVYALSRAPIECVHYSLLELRRFGVHWPLRPSRRRVLRAARRVQRMLRNRSDENLLEPAKTIDRDKLATFLLIDLTGASLAQADSCFSVLGACTVLSDYLRHGYIARPGFTLAAYATCLFWIHRDAELAARVGRLALEWCRRVPDALWDPRTEFLIHALLEPWFTSRHETAHAVRSAGAQMAELGDTEWVYHSDCMLLLNDLLAGSRVMEIDARLAELSHVAARDFRYSDFEYIRRVYRPLVEERIDAVELDDDVFASDLPRGVGWESNEPIVRTARLMVLAVYGRYERLLAESELGLDQICRLSPWTHNADYTFYRGLAATIVGGKRRLVWSRERRISRHALRDLERLAGHGPDFVHMSEILEAEHCRLGGKVAEARRLYQSAALNATRQQFIHHAALAHERHAGMLRDLRRQNEAVQVLNQAIACYTQWGARAKAGSLEPLLAD